MGVINKESVWHENIYALEINDPVKGGPTVWSGETPIDGFSNAPIKQLADNIQWLFDKVIVSPFEKIFDSQEGDFVPGETTELIVTGVENLEEAIVEVYFDGLQQFNTEYVVSENTIIFNEVVPSGTDKIKVSVKQFTEIVGADPIGSAQSVRDDLANPELGATLVSNPFGLTLDKTASTVANVEELKSLSIPEGLSKESLVVRVMGYFNENDGGGGLFYWDESSELSVDEGVVFSSENSTTGRWIRMLGDYITPLMFGADRTGSVSSTDAFNRTTNYMRSKIGGQGDVNNTASYVIVVPTGTYLIDGSGWDLTDIRRPRGIHVIGYGATIIGETPGYPVIDAIDSRWVNLHGLTIRGSEINTPRVGIQIGKGAQTTIGNNYIGNCTVSGYYTLAPLFNNASETTVNFRNKYENRYDDPLSYAAVIDGAHYWGITSSYIISSYAPGTATSFTQNFYYGCDFRNLAAGNTCWVTAASGLFFDEANYFVSFNDANFVLYVPGTGRCSELEIRGHFESASESPIVTGTTGLKTVVRLEGDGQNTSIQGFVLYCRTPHASNQLIEVVNLGDVNRISNAKITNFGYLHATSATWFGGTGNLQIDGELYNNVDDARFNIGFLSKFDGVIHTVDRTNITTFPSGSYTIYDRTNSGMLQVGKIEQATVNGGALTHVIRTFDTIADLKNYIPDPVFNDKSVVYEVLGYYARGDGGGGDFYWDASSSATEDGGTIFTPTLSPTSGRWFRIYDGVLEVKYFGAKGDYNPNTDTGTDDTDAINLAFAEMRRRNIAHSSRVSPTLRFSAGANYLVNGSLNVTNIRSLATPNTTNFPTIEGSGAKIIGRGANNVIIDMTRSLGIRLRDLTIYGDPLNPPKIGIQMSRGAPTESADFHVMESVRLDGSFTFSAVYNNASERFFASGCSFRNSLDAAGTYAYVIDGRNKFNVQSQYYEITVPVDTPQSCLSHIFTQCSFLRSGSETTNPLDAVYFTRCSRVSMRGCYGVASSGGAVCVFATDSSTFRNVDLDVHTEPSHVGSVFRFESAVVGANNIVFDQFKWSDHRPYSTLAYFHSTLSGNVTFRTSEFYLGGNHDPAPAEGIFYPKANFTIHGEFKVLEYTPPIDLSIARFDGDIYCSSVSSLTQPLTGSYRVVQNGGASTWYGNHVHTTSESWPKGTWTPTATFSTPGDVSISYTTQVGNWVKIGNMVFVQGVIVFTPTFTTASGELQIGGLPFVSLAGGNINNGVTIDRTGQNLTWPTGVTQLTGRVPPSSTFLVIRGSGSLMNTITIDASHLVSGTQYVFGFSGTYISNS